MKQENIAVLCGDESKTGGSYHFAIRMGTRGKRFCYVRPNPETEVTQLRV